VLDREVVLPLYRSRQWIVVIVVVV